MSKTPPRKVIFLWQCPLCHTVFTTKEPRWPHSCPVCERPEAVFPDYLTWGRTWRYADEDRNKDKSNTDWNI